MKKSLLALMTDPRRQAFEEALWIIGILLGVAGLAMLKLR